ncbi:hypothetical protein Q8791_23325 [Nocardiopsis sp. CT-R113]|uniref:Uncharacterized protein n=1 Tax=Nocardiopsis codii TaxID=3065942 RepID=A0ABU7KEY1_9ACTN|nr:hypothetical protein [Nocardiopsis sp. CT-R113]MEE2040152.1 hypothetical protein [Nocardiopsis sp. CT-R113]
MTIQTRPPYANDGTPLIPRYMAYAETVAPGVMAARERAAADAAAGLARLEQIAAQQEFDTAKARLEAARKQVDAADTLHLGVAVRQWHDLVTT